MMLLRLLFQLMAAVAIGEHEIYEDHIRVDGSLPTPQAVFQANSRVTNDIMENALGHRSGIGASGLGAAANGVREQGVQTSVQAYVYPGAGPPTLQAMSWRQQARDRFNVENW